MPQTSAVAGLVFVSDQHSVSGPLNGTRAPEDAERRRATWTRGRSHERVRSARSNSAFGATTTCAEPSITLVGAWPLQAVPRLLLPRAEGEVQRRSGEGVADVQEAEPPEVAVAGVEGADPVLA